MDFVSYAVSIVVAFSGLVIGAILAFISPEEMPTGKKYFPLLQKAILIAFLAFFVNALGLPFWIRLIAYLLVLTYAFGRSNTVVMYPFLALVLFFASFNPSAFTTLITLTFLYGLPTGSMYAASSKTSKYRTVVSLILKHSFFLVIAFAMPLIFKLL